LEWTYCVDIVIVYRVVIVASWIGVIINTIVVVVVVVLRAKQNILSAKTAQVAFHNTVADTYITNAYIGCSTSRCLGQGRPR
jgi:hypothetical protein